MSNYNSYRAYLKKRFGVPVLKIPVSAGFSCPNRDGVKSLSGCTFCDNRAFSPAAEATGSALDQLQKSISRASTRYKAFIAYLQPFSNTYGSVDRLRAVYEPLINVPGVVGLAIGTRPDCFTDEVYDYLGDLAGRTYLSIELGLQSSHDATLALVNRGHTFGDFAVTVKRLAAPGIATVAHAVLGLPGESSAMMFETASSLAALPVSGVKVHQLMIIKDTPMERVFTEGKVSALTIEEYAPLLSGFLSRLRPDQHIHRIMAEIDNSATTLVAPAWSAHKQASMQFLQSYLEKNEVVQGNKYKKN
jgi:uncharacterized protein